MTDLLADIAMRSQIMQEARRTEEMEGAAAQSIADVQSIADARRGDDVLVSPEPIRNPTEIMDVDDAVWCAWLGGLAPDNMLVLLVDAPIDMRERVVATLDESSQVWMQDNLALLGTVTAANARQAWAHAWTVFDALICAEKTDVSVSVVADEEHAGTVSVNNGLRAQLTQIMRLHEHGCGVWNDNIAAVDDQLLAAALELARMGAAAHTPTDSDALRQQLEMLKSEHLAHEAQRSTCIIAAVESCVTGVTAESFKQLDALK